MKTTMKQLAAGTFIALLLLVGNVSAKGTEAKASGRESSETILRVEKWMTDEFLWNTNSVNITEFALETETTMEIENWMINSEIPNPGFGFAEEIETGMQFENWMTSDATWNVIYTDNDTALTVESWMTENNIL